MTLRNATTTLSALALLAVTQGCGGPAVDFVVEAGPAVTLGRVNRPTRAQVSDWTAHVADFWRDHYARERVGRALETHSVAFVDDTVMQLPSGLVAGYTQGHRSFVGVRLHDGGDVDWSYVSKLYQHELGHAVLVAVGVAPDQALHHQMFATLGYAR